MKDEFMDTLQMETTSDWGRLSVRRCVGEQRVLSQNHGWERMNGARVEVCFGDPGAASVFWIVKGDAFHRTRESVHSEKSTR